MEGEIIALVTFLVALIGIFRDNRPQNGSSAIVGLNGIGFLLLLLAAAGLVMTVFKERKDVAERAIQAQQQAERHTELMTLYKRQEDFIQTLIPYFKKPQRDAAHSPLPLRSRSGDSLGDFSIEKPKSSPGEEAKIGTDEGFQLNPAEIPKAVPVPKQPLQSPVVTEETMKSVNEQFKRLQEAKPKKVKAADVPVVSGDIVSNTFARLNGGVGYKTNPKALNDTALTLREYPSLDSNAIVRITSGQRVRSPGGSQVVDGTTWVYIYFRGNNGMDYWGYVVANGLSKP